MVKIQTHGRILIKFEVCGYFMTLPLEIRKNYDKKFEKHHVFYQKTILV